MKNGAKKLLSMLCALTLLLGLVPAGSAATVPEHDHAVAELPVTAGEDYTVVEVPETPEEVPEDPTGDLEGDGPVGVMPAPDSGDPEVESPSADEADQDQAVTLLAVQAGHTHNFNDGNLKSSFYTFDKSGKTPSTTTKDTPATITTSDGKSLTINKALKMESATTISFTAPEAGQLTIYCGNAGGTSFKCGGKTYEVSGGKAAIPTPQGACAVSRGSGESHIVYLEWQSSGCAVHTWGTTYIQVTAPTCTEAGAEANQCTVCGATNPETRPVNALGHDFQNYTQTLAPTCAAQGLETAKCSRCDETDTRAVAATGNHTYSGGKCTQCGVLEGKTPCATHTFGAPEETPASCTAPGERKQTCSVCGMTVTTVLPATGHSWGQWSVKTTATCQTEGEEARRCANCQEEETRKTGFGPHQFNGSTCTVCGATAGIVAGGWFESLYAELDGVTDAQVTAVTYTGPMSGALAGEDLEYLVRNATLSSGKSGVRIDIPGLTPGTYSLEVQAGGRFVASNIQVLAHDRSGYAHFNYTEGVGGYRDDGILKDGAIVLYVTEATKNTVKLTAPDGTTVTGIGHILNTVGCQSKNGGKNNNNQNILQKLADANIPLVVRIIGKVTDPDGTTAFNSEDYGGTVGDNGGMVRMKSAKNITVEGIGTDAEMNGWGMHFIAAGNDPAAGRGRGFEVRNITFKDVPEDCVGMEGQYDGGKFSPVQRGWVHNCSFYPANITNPAESDKKEGDGSCDFKRGEYFTMSYNYFEGCHKTNLVGSGDSDAAGPQYHITWHHNHWVNCKARGPLSRKANIHIYNCLYENQTDYAQNPRVNTYIFSEYNTFLNCKQPRLLTSGGVIKSYMDALGSNITDDAGVNTVTDKTKTVSTNNQYANFDTDPKLSYIPAGDYKLDQSTLAARANIYAYTGPMKAAKDMVTPQEVHASTVAKERMPAGAVALPYDKAIDGSYVTGDTTKDNIIFTGGTGSGSGYKFTKSTTGQNVVFTVKESVNITIAGTGINLINADSGNAVLKEPGTASGLPAGTYYIQPNNFQPGDQTGAGFSFKDGTLTHLTIQAASKPSHVHSYSTTGTVAKAATCSATGLMRYNCTGCDDYKLETIPMTPHNYVGGFCSMCGLSDSVLDDPDVTHDPVQSVTLDQTSVTIEQGSAATLVATVLPTTAKGTLTWTTSDPSVATVSQRGVVAGQKAGYATITATSVADNTKYASCQVQVVGVTNAEYTFAATDYSSVTDQAKVANGTKLGTKDYFTVSGTGTVWRNSDKTKPLSLLTGTQESTSMDFTVAAGATATVSVSCVSTGGSNHSAMALIGPDGSRVVADNSKSVHDVYSNKSTTTVTYSKLAPGTYKIVSAKVQNASELGLPNLTDNANDVNSRGVRITAVKVTETVRSGNVEFIDVQSVSLDKTAASVAVNETLALKATVAPDNASNKTVTWTSSDDTVARVSTSGVVTGRKAGSATITARAGSRTATCTVTVTGDNVVAVTGVTVTPATAEVEVGKTVTLTATVAPANATNKDVVWTSSGDAATVVGGVVTGRKAGTATITANASGYTAAAAITVKVAQSNPDETHTPVWKTTKAATCTEPGSRDYVCSKCGAVLESEVIPAKGHDWSKWSVTKAATCTVAGSQTRTCSACKATEIDEILPAGHDYGPWQTVRESTCQEPGLRRRYCQVCKTSDDEDIALAKHNWGEWFVTVAPTCTEDGQQAQVCSVGGERNVEELSALGHTFENGKCIRCHMSEDVDEHEHNWGKGWTTSTPATCVKAGVETRTCSVAGCDAQEKRDVAALGHDFGAWTVTVKPTCEVKGTESRKCSRCNQTQLRDLPATGHSYNADGKCTVCGATQGAVVVPVTGVTLSLKNATLKTGETLTLTATVKPSNATDKNVTWSSSATAVAIVSQNGKVTARKPGKATISVTTADGDQTATCAVTVIANNGGGGGGGGGGTGGGGGGGGSAQPTQPAQPTTQPTGMAFVDVKSEDWFCANVKRAFEKGLMKGTDATHFTPHANTTRATIATVLFRLDGEKETNVRAAFADVTSGQWYSEAVEWASAKGIVKGYDDVTFAPNDNVTREQLAVMLYRYAAPTQKSTKDLSAFTDAGSISSWATEAITWAVDKGIITGKGAGILDPQGLATRAEICTMLVRFLDLK